MSERSPSTGSRSLIGPERAERFESTAATARALLDGRTVLNVNSTATGGGVAELLQTLLAYARGAGVDARWVVIEGDPRFFEITKRLHNHLYGTPGDGGPLGAAEHADYEDDAASATSRTCCVDRPSGRHRRAARPADRAGLAAAVQRAGARVVWRCHVGIDTPNEHSERGWEFLRPYVEGGRRLRVLARTIRAAAGYRGEHLAVIAPSIDPFSAKNEPIDDATVRAAAPARRAARRRTGASPAASFTRRDGSRGRVTRTRRPARYRAAAAASTSRSCCRPRAGTR